MGKKVIAVGGKNTPIVPCEPGSKGLQSPTNYRLDLIPPEAIFSLGRILQTGAEKYGEDNWKEIPSRNHINKALIHLYAYLAGDTQDEHLDHAFTRIAMAIATKEEQE